MVLHNQSDGWRPNLTSGLFFLLHLPQNINYPDINHQNHHHMKLTIYPHHQISGCTFRGLDCLTTIDSDDEDSFIMDYEVNFRRQGFLLNYDPRWYGAQFTETALTFLPPMSLLANPH